MNRRLEAISKNRFSVRAGPFLGLTALRGSGAPLRLRDF